MFDEEHRPIVCVYRQFDGYPDGHGEDLKSILLGIPIVNGISVESRNQLLFNGMYELAALLVRGLKDRYPRGNIYLVPPAWPPEDHGQDYIWVVTGRWVSVQRFITLVYMTTMSGIVGLVHARPHPVAEQFVMIGGRL
ncbi:hypothetical protein DRO59_02285 [Candidatus Bathyarchaeota archaeon]|nr:MAG: hypothetical protein DRO59_02285 [Candidatus Bathyarchaeota archaeon]